MTTLDIAVRTARTRALRRIAYARDGRGRHERRFDAAREADLLAYAATLSDEAILDWRNTGPGILGWIRTHQPTDTPQTDKLRLRLASLAQGEAGSAAYDEPEWVPTVSTIFAETLKRSGWRVEVFWNGGGGWFTARLVSLYDRDGNRNRSYSGGFLVPFDDPIGASGATPEEALANLSEAVLEWA
jgi:hypothetical protein